MTAEEALAVLHALKDAEEFPFHVPQLAEQHSDITLSATTIDYAALEESRRRLDETMARSRENMRLLTEVNHRVCVFPGDDITSLSPEQRFGPFFDRESAERKRAEIESACHQQGLNKRVEIFTRVPTKPLSPPDEPYRP